MRVLRFQGVVQYQDSPKIIASILNILVSTRVNIVCFSCSRLRLIPVLACESQILNRQWRLSAKIRVAVIGDPYFYPCISCKALQSWSGQDVTRFPHRIPSNLAMASSTLIPLTNRLIPWRFPLHPPQKNTCWMIPFSTSNSMWLLQVPCVL